MILRIIAIFSQAELVFLAVAFHAHSRTTVSSSVSTVEPPGLRLLGSLGVDSSNNSDRRLVPHRLAFLS